jgi:hypothetical protein
VFLEELSMQFYSQTQPKERNNKLPKRWSNSGRMLQIPNFTKIGSEVLPEVSSSREDFTIALL